MITVNELKERLEEIAENGGGDFEVRMATQPSWPLQFTIRSVVEPERWAYDEPDEDEEDNPEDRIVYLVEGSSPQSTPYAPKWVFEA